jgi:hypothetical protein
MMESSMRFTSRVPQGQFPTGCPEEGVHFASHGYSMAETARLTRSDAALGDVNSIWVLGDIFEMRIAVAAESSGYQTLLRFPSAEGVCGLFAGSAAAERGANGSEPEESHAFRQSCCKRGPRLFERDDDLGLQAIMPFVVTGKTDSRMKTNATSARCGDESSRKRDRRVKTQLLVQDRENS